MKKIISTDRAPAAIGPYAQAVVVNGFAFLSGQIPIDPATNQLIEGDVVAQSLGQVVKTTVFVKDLGEFAKINETYARYFPENPPARATVEAARLPRDVRVEIECVAVVS